MKIGVLAVQGAFAEHEKKINALGAECIQLRQKKDIMGLSGIILPGGESTVQGKLLKELDMFDFLKGQIEKGLPVLATCAGLILLAQEIANDTKRYFCTLPVCVSRNAYGRQLGSFSACEELKGVGKIEMRFIRAPHIDYTAEDVEILAWYDGAPTAVRYKNQLAMAFHPELSEDFRIHQMFLNMCM